MAWIKNAPQYNVNTDDEVCKYIDQCISCSSKVLSNEREYLLMKQHKHSHTCMKKNHGVKICRFGDQWLPLRKTQILQPLNTETELANKKFHTETFATIQQFLISVPAKTIMIIWWIFERTKHIHSIRPKFFYKEICLTTG